MRISDWSSDVCSSDLHYPVGKLQRLILIVGDEDGGDAGFVMDVPQPAAQVLSHLGVKRAERLVQQQQPRLYRTRARERPALPLTTRKPRSERPPSEPPSLKRNTYALLCFHKNTKCDSTIQHK